MHKMVTVHVEIDDSIHKYKGSYISYYTQTHTHIFIIYENSNFKGMSNLTASEKS